MRGGTSVGEQDFTMPGPTGRQQRWDVAIGLLVVLGILTSSFLYRSVTSEGIDGPLPSALETVLWSVAIGLPLCLRRRFPVAVMLITSVAFIGMQSRYVVEGTMSSIALFSSLYTVGAWGRDRRVAGAARLLVVVVMFCWLAYAISATAWAETTDGVESAGPVPAHLASALYSTLINILFFAGAWYFGDASWNRAREQEQLRQRTLELARERDESARRAVLAERVRIARELHDVVAHHVSLMGVQAGAARRVLDRDPELTRRTLGVIEESGRSAVEEMRRLLVVLRDPDDSPTVDDEKPGVPPSPGTDALPQLLESAASPGLATHFTVVGTPVPLTAAVSVSLYRIAQEALTNALKHAGASRIDARLRYLAEAVELELVDDGRGAGLPGSQGSGLGQVGMRERVDLHGGTLDIGRRPEGGYRVRARLPLVRHSSHSVNDAEVVK
ncbi:sensor histidine kinase [Kineosporia sp. J2-2]|uniref:histidine kinase n=1 Tax=Kineosporia corallincola TaxID=2835133 RepID=A0ABS5TSS6_9ACTN|nr:sensor histidine kinase [Kineosporia corallincola]MBT0773814.1 sensor histidine kinase [Kineosporia corallincola]